MSTGAILKLQKVGFTSEQVEALADFMDIQVASKADLAETEHRLELKVADVKADVIEVRSDLKLIEQRMTIKLGGMLVVAVGVLLAAMRFFAHG